MTEVRPGFLIWIAHILKAMHKTNCMRPIICMKNSATYVCHNDCDLYDDIAIQGAGVLCPAKNVATFSTAVKKFNNQTLMMIATITREVVSSVQPKVSQPSPQPPWNYGAKGGSPSPYRSKSWALLWLQLTMLKWKFWLWCRQPNDIAELREGGLLACRDAAYPRNPTFLNYRQDGNLNGGDDKLISHQRKEWFWSQVEQLPEPLPRPMTEVNLLLHNQWNPLLLSAISLIKWHQCPKVIV